jgi:hypothetical protein
MVLVVEADRVNALPEQTGVFEEGVGVLGVWFTITVVVPAGEVQPLIVTVTLYVPLAAVVAFGIEGSSAELEKLFGPVQFQVGEPEPV